MATLMHSASSHTPAISSGVSTAVLGAFLATAAGGGAFGFASQDARAAWTPKITVSTPASVGRVNSELEDVRRVISRIQEASFPWHRFLETDAPESDATRIDFELIPSDTVPLRLSGFDENFETWTL